MQHLTDFSRSSQITLCRFESDADVVVRRCTSAFDTELAATAHNKFTPSVIITRFYFQLTAYKTTC